MLRRISMMFIAIVLLAAPSTAIAQEANAEDHEQLRALLTNLTEVVNAGRFDEVEKYLYEPFSATMINQETVTTPEELKAYFEKWVTGEGALIESITMAPEADEQTTIYDGKYGTVRGSNVETYELATGNAYSLTSRWTATMIKDEGQWKILTIHSGVNIIDNPILTAAKESLTLFAAGGVAGGVLGTLILCWLFRRRRTA